MPLIESVPRISHINNFIFWSMQWLNFKHNFTSNVLKQIQNLIVRKVADKFMLIKKSTNYLLKPANIEIMNDVFKWIIFFPDETQLLINTQQVVVKNFSQLNFYKFWIGNNSYDFHQVPTTFVRSFNNSIKWVKLRCYEEK